MSNAKLFVVLLVCAANLAAENVKFSRATGNVIQGKGKIQTGSSSRIEVELPYLAVVRVGSNAELKFDPGYREMDLSGGTLMASVPKGAGDVIIRAGPVAAVLANGGALEMSNVGGRGKLVVLDGKVGATLTANPSKQKMLRSGQMVDVPAGATVMPPVGAFNMGVLIKTSVLINMGPFPGLRAIKQNATKQRPPAMPMFVTGGFDPDWGGGGPTSLATIGPAGTAAMVGRLERGVPEPLPVIPEGQVPTQNQAQLFADAGQPIPNVTTVEGRQLLRGERLRVLREFRERMRPPVPVATPVPTPVPQPTRPPRPGNPLPRPPSLRPPIAPP